MSSLLSRSIELYREKTALLTMGVYAGENIPPGGGHPLPSIEHYESNKPPKSPPSKEPNQAIGTSAPIKAKKRKVR